MMNRDNYLKIAAGIVFLMFLCPVFGQTADVKLQKIRDLMDAAAAGGNKNVTYIVSGDSTRDSYIAGQEYIYSTMLAQINVRYVHNARSGLRAYQWVRNSVADACLKKAVANSAGEGENTIMEFSLGINDRNAFSRADTKRNLKESIVKYLKAKPKAHVFLVVPVTHMTSFQKDWLKLYSELADELDLPLVNRERVMYDAFYDKDNRFYYDNTHPDYFGALRMTRYILETVSGPVAKKKFDWRKVFVAPSKDLPTGVNLAAGKKIIPKSWYWPHNKTPSMKGGAPYSHPTMSRVEPFSVKGGTIISISGVDPKFASVMDASGRLRYTFCVPKWKKHDLHYLYIPPGITEVRLTIARPASGTAAPQVKYLTDGALSDLTPSNVYYK